MHIHGERFMMALAILIVFLFILYLKINTSFESIYRTLFFFYNSSYLFVSTVYTTTNEL